MAQRNAQARGDMETNQFAMQEMADDAAVRRGIAPTLPAGFDVVRAAGGGIIAFEEGGNVDLQKILDQNNDDAEYENDNEEDGAGGGYADRISREILNQSRALNNLGANDTPMTTEERVAQLATINAALRKQAGTDTGYADFSKRLADMESSSQDRLSEGRGLALLQAIPAMLQGGNAIRGIGNAGAAFGNVYSQYVNAANKEKLSLAQMQYSLADAKRKENLGLTKDAVALMENARKSEMDAKKFAVDKVNAQARLLGKGAVLNKPVKAATPNFDIENRNNLAETLKATTPLKKGETPEQYDTRLKSLAAMQIYGVKNTKDIKSNVTSNVTSNQTRDITPGGAEEQLRTDANAIALAKEQDAAMKDLQGNNYTYATAQRKGDTATMRQMEQDVRNRFPTARSALSSSVEAVTPGAKPAAPAPGARTAPSLTAFLVAARKSNPGISDADLTAYYNKKYGKQ